MVAASFFNASLGFLLRDFAPGELNRLVKVSHLSPWARKVLLRVVKNCRRIYQEESGQFEPQYLMAGKVNPGSEASCGWMEIK